MPTEPKSNTPDWEEIQRHYSTIKGEAGIELRRQYYPPYFLRFGDDVIIEEDCRFICPDRIVLDNHVHIGSASIINGGGGVWVGRHASLGRSASIDSTLAGTTHVQTGDEGNMARDLPVYIGEAATIAGAVNIQAGARVNTGCLVATGTVVTGVASVSSPAIAEHPAGQKTAGEKAGPPDYKTGSEIVIISDLPSMQGYFRLLLNILGLPQITVQSPSEPLSPDAHSIILAGTDDLKPERYQKFRVWRMVDGDISHSKNGSQPSIKVTLPFKGPVLCLPSYDYLDLVPSPGARDDYDNLSRNSAFWLFQRLDRVNAPLSRAEFLEWCCTVMLLNIQPDREDGLLEWTLSRLWHNWPHEAQDKKPASYDSCATRYKKTVSAWVNCVSTDVRISKIRSVLAIVSKRQRLIVRRRKYLRYPYPGLLLWEVLNDQGVLDKNIIIDIIRELLPSLKNTRQLLVLLLSAIICKADDLSDTLIGRLSDESWWHTCSPFPYLAEDKDGLLLSPLVLVYWLYRKTGRFDEIGEMAIHKPDRTQRVFEWKQFRSDRHEWRIQEQDVLIDPGRRLISNSLMENWVLMQRAPDIGNKQFYLNTDNYNDGIRRVEELWLSLFDFIQSEQARPLLKLHPLPAPYRAAVSLRYDVDRPIDKVQLSEIISAQSRLFNAPCATWYFRGFDHCYDEYNATLKRNWQYRGVHAESLTAERMHEGVTFHSAPTSCYWRGKDAVELLSSNGASYMEFLLGDVIYPRPALEYIDHGVRKSGIPLYLIPLHFPLEGSTRDNDLEYFDRQLGYFREKLKKGGHIIISSHPDLNQNLLDDLLKREDFSHVWFTSTENVISRIHEVLFHSTIQTLERHDKSAGSIALVSAAHLSDVQLEIRFKGQAIGHEIVQFSPHTPRKIFVKGIPVS